MRAERCRSDEDGGFLINNKTTQDKIKGVGLKKDEIF